MEVVGDVKFDDFISLPIKLLKIVQYDFTDQDTQISILYHYEQELCS